MKILKYIIKFLSFIERYGIVGLFTYFIPVYWEQDIKFVNEGRDLFFFKKSEHFYFYGTLRERDEEYKYQVN